MTIEQTMGLVEVCEAVSRALALLRAAGRSEQLRLAHAQRGKAFLN